MAADGCRPGRLTRRAEFLHVGRGRRWHGKALTLQMAPRRDPAAEPAEPPRFGLTLTKKVGCAVVRNRARRRLREALRLLPDLSARPGHDYVVVGRLEAIRLPFDAVRREIARAVAAIHAAEPSRGSAKQGSAKQGSAKQGSAGGKRARDRKRRPTRTGPERIWPNP